MSFYRKYRPQTFEDVVGQDHVARTLRNALTAVPPRVAHAYLFTGPRGIGKTTNARLLAKCLNCENGPTPIPCNQCDFCVRVTNNQPVMDLVEIDAASNTGVDNVRDNIIEKVGMMPAQGRYRVTIIDEVHMLSMNAFNALLKTIEEPPAHAIFILATTELQKVPATIISRCQRFDFRSVTPADIALRLHYVAGCEGINLSEEAAKLIARHASGALRDALTLLEQVAAFAGEEITPADVRLVLGGVPQELITALVENIGLGNAHAVLETLERAVAQGASFSQLGRDLTAYLRDLLLISVGFPGEIGLSPEELAIRQHHVQMLGRARLETTLTALREASKEMRENVDHRLIVELTLVRASQNSVAAPSLAPVAAPTLAAGLRPVAAPNGAVPAWKQSAPARIEPPKVAITLPEEAIHTTVEAIPPFQEAVSTKNEAVDAEYEVNDASEATVAPLEPTISTTVEAVAVPEEVATVSETETPLPEVEAAPAPRKKGRRIANFDDLTELWPAVLMRIRKKIGVTAVAYLHDARPVGFTSDDVILEFVKEFHHAKACDAADRLGFEKIINETLDKPRHLKLQLAAPAPKIVAEVVEIEEEDNDEFDGEAPGNIIDYAQSVFGADIVGRSG
ncbi:DNA polymerase-3 subunit gamma/tau [Abditibacterium utsteinense]|uniref:DNA polymerase III subunit gamma/tau n=1 Tax=Abditibacterium utsteinense TaxID=1960156 RepID=A0A2S8SSR9_9BACT|nr:DNA polymerase III subunit gamma/tau [Abditibacterium utsteinense]PQV63850.1 DNA polymerase-3 subunit gamma/tau [Abditibacterium utsteinense]